MKRKRQPMGPALGNALAAIDGQIFRSTPPSHELVHHARPDLEVATGDGGRLVIALPPEPGVDDAGSSPTEDAPGGRGGA